MTTRQEALRFINRYGIVTLFPIRGLSFPNLYEATFGKSKEERFQRAWEWADYLSEKKKIHYGKLVRGQVTLISLEMFPHFYGIRRECKLSKSAQNILGFLRKKEQPPGCFCGKISISLVKQRKTNSPKLLMSYRQHFT